MFAQDKDKFRDVIYLKNYLQGNPHVHFDILISIVFLSIDLDNEIVVIDEKSGWSRI